MNTFQNQFSIAIDGSYQIIEPARGAIVNTSEWRRGEGPSLLRGR